MNYEVSVQNIPAHKEKTIKINPPYTKPLTKILFERDDLLKMYSILIEIGNQYILQLDTFWINHLIKESMSHKINILAEFIDKIPINLLKYHEFQIKFAVLNPDVNLDVNPEFIYSDDDDDDVKYVELPIKTPIKTPVIDKALTVNKNVI